MTSNRSKKTSIAAKNAEIEWVVAHERESSAELSLDPERGDEQEADVHQPSPDEPVWLPTEPQGASDAADEPRVAKKAPRAAGAKPGRSKGKALKSAANAVTNDVAPTTSARTAKRAPKRSAGQSDDPAGTSAQGDAGEREGMLAEEHATGVTAATEPSAAPPVTKKGKLQKFVAERADQRALEHEEERAAGVPAEHSDQPLTPIVGEPGLPIPSDIPAAMATDAPTEPASSLPSMEQYIAELATLNVRELAKRHVEMLGKAPRIKNATWLRRKLAWHEQSRRFGGLSGAAKKRLDELMGTIELPTPMSRASKTDAPATRSADDMPLGTRIERTWHDREIVATRVEGGWDCEGKVHRTLSAAAKAVSGSHVSGPAWFGIWRPKGGTR